MVFIDANKRSIALRLKKVLVPGFEPGSAG